MTLISLRRRRASKPVCEDRLASPLPRALTPEEKLWLEISNEVSLKRSTSRYDRFVGLMQAARRCVSSRTRVSPAQAADPPIGGQGAGVLRGGRQHNINYFRTQPEGNEFSRNIQELRAACGGSVSTSNTIPRRTGSEGRRSPSTAILAKTDSEGGKSPSSSPVQLDLEGLLDNDFSAWQAPASASAGRHVLFPREIVVGQSS
mmetsp:Transcript_71627/g.213787  ORF Transcript_71627/g.213787 Transcript_71627/m.213787 type:complete len:203 (+) Transcript_71627:40-648(+)|eukprot:CAMPEP_0175198008 /NCGR_PEP_ID=MMETSP0093-20121207/8307_1 /TAXON_ID=311494 /ORGANISM="Alexandrium monilatum, Strain CCMP3105" /LENGTH=202 /DNA_ID=CAMNT_0016490991 /DNA_START=31 /DNA_END=639 /DNA_ORIENTATION=-